MKQIVSEIIISRALHHHMAFVFNDVTNMAKPKTHIKMVESASFNSDRSYPAPEFGEWSSVLIWNSIKLHDCMVYK